MKRILWLLIFSLACSLTTQTPHTTPSPTDIGLIPVIETPIPPTPLPIQDVSNMLMETCFEALFALDGQHLVIADEAALTQFYNLLDGYCSEQPIPRVTFDFATQVVVMAVETAQACDADLIPLHLEAQQLMLQFVQSGTCPYEVIAVYMGTLARPAGEFQVVITGA